MWIRDLRVDGGAGSEIRVRVIPRARRSEVAGTRGDALVVRLAAPPVEGAANDALIVLLAEVLGVGKRAIRITAGDHSRTKRVAVAGVSAAAARVCVERTGADRR